MQRPSSLVFVAALALSTAAAASPAPREAWASGRLARVDTAAHSVVVTQGTHEMTFVLGANAQLTLGKQLIAPAALSSDVGHQVRVRYTMDKGTRVADHIQVSETHATPSPKAGKGK